MTYPSEDELDEARARRLPLFLAAVCVLLIVAVFAWSAYREHGSACTEGTPLPDTGRCAHSAARVVVEDRVAVCRCEVSP